MKSTPGKVEHLHDAPAAGSSCAALQGCSGDSSTWCLCFTAAPMVYRNNQQPQTTLHFRNHLKGLNPILDLFGKPGMPECLRELLRNFLEDTSADNLDFLQAHLRKSLPNKHDQEQRTKDQNLC